MYRSATYDFLFYVPWKLWAYLAPFPRETAISVEDCRIFQPRVFCAPRFELGIGAVARKTGMMALAVGPKSLKIGFAV